MTLLTDGMAGWLMARGEIACVVVGADRIAANGDVANKIGTYALAVLAAHHLPFYVAAPWSTVDLHTADGEAIPIEERGAEEVLTLAGQRIAPAGVPARYPAFDVTPEPLVTALITERGVVRRPFGPGSPPSPRRRCAAFSARHRASNIRAAWRTSARPACSDTPAAA